MKFNRKQREDDAKKEFIFIVEKYILPMFDVSGDLTQNNSTTLHNTNLIEISENDGVKNLIIYPFVSRGKISPDFFCSIKTRSGLSLIKPANVILKELLKVAEFDYRDLSKQNDYGNFDEKGNSYKKRTFDLAFELGMCKWLTSRGSDASVLHAVISQLINWASRTYEGKNVPFGIVIDFSKNQNNSGADYLHFLNNDSSAVFTDGVFSGIMLDRNGTILSFLSRNADNVPNENRHIFAPFQFANIASYCQNQAIGIIALTSGEILIIKKGAIRFAKRGSKWVTFDWERVCNALRPYFLLDESLTFQQINNKIKEIYSTILDVSFAHTGGCIAIVVPSKETSLTGIIKERIDLYDLHLSDGSSDVSEESKERIGILTYLLKYPNNAMKSFFDIDRVLRKEILSLDGATVVSLSGSFFCAGSIVAVPSGSSGGGRTAAAKKLAEYGIGIKISEDGYVEAYGMPLVESCLFKDDNLLFCFK